MGSVGDTAAEIMLDSGSSVSLLRQELAQKATGVVRTQPRQEIRLVTAAGESLPILEYVKATVRLGTPEKLHDFVVVKDLITAVILHGNRFSAIARTSVRFHYDSGNCCSFKA